MPAYDKPGYETIDIRVFAAYVGLYGMKTDHLSCLVLLEQPLLVISADIGAENKWLHSCQRPS